MNKFYIRTSNFGDIYEEKAGSLCSSIFSFNWNCKRVRRQNSTVFNCKKVRSICIT